MWKDSIFVRQHHVVHQEAEGMVGLEHVGGMAGPEPVRGGVAGPEPMGGVDGL